MGDRRKGDRRAPEEGVIRIQKKNIMIYVVVIAFLILAIILNIISWKKYFKTREEFNTVIDHIYNDETNNTTNTEASSNITETSNNYSCDISINGNKERVKPGESIEYELKASNIRAEGGIKTFEAFLDYDSNVLDCQVESDKDGKWMRSGLLEGYLTMDKANLEASAEDQIIAKITVTPKDTISDGEYHVKLTNIKFTSGDNQTFEAADNDIKIIVKQ